MSNVEKNSVTVNDSTVAYLESGPKDGPAAILVHGIPASAELWRGVMIILSDHGWHCYAPDLPGYGRTVLPVDADYSVRGSAELLSDWIEQEQLDNIWLVGHDIGGGVCQILTTMNEKRFNKLTYSNCITADTWPVVEIKIMVQSAKLHLFKLFASTGILSTSIGRAAISCGFADSRVFTKEVSERAFWDTKVSTSEGREKFHNMLVQLDPQQTMDNMPALSQVKVPVELVWGLKDTHQPWDGPGKILRETFPDAKILTLPDAGHFLQIDSTQAYADALLVEK